MFHVGQLVICVDARPAPDGEPMPIRLGTIYTVARWAVFPEVINGPGVVLAEPAAQPRARFGYWAPAYDPARFRPIDDSKIEVFRKALKDVPADLETVS